MKLNKEEMELVLNYLTQLEEYLKSGETFDFNNKWDFNDGLELEKFISKIRNRHVGFAPPISIVWKGF
jgi:hypothetical protein